MLDQLQFSSLDSQNINGIFSYWMMDEFTLFDC